jgi:hypothetical protein
MRRQRMIAGGIADKADFWLDCAPIGDKLELWKKKRPNFCGVCKTSAA